MAPSDKAAASAASEVPYTKVPKSTMIPTLIIAISGTPCSGKATLAQVLHDVVREALKSTKAVEADRMFYLQDVRRPAGSPPAPRNRLQEMFDRDVLEGMDCGLLEDQLTRADSSDSDSKDDDCSARAERMKGAARRTEELARMPAIPTSTEPGSGRQGVFQQAVGIVRDGVLAECGRAGIPANERAADRGYLAHTNKNGRAAIVDCHIRIVKSALLFAEHYDDYALSPAAAAAAAARDKQLARLRRLRRFVDVGLFLPMLPPDALKRRLQKPECQGLFNQEQTIKQFWNVTWPNYVYAHRHITQELDFPERIPPGTPNIHGHDVRRLRVENRVSLAKYPGRHHYERTVKCRSSTSRISGGEGEGEDEEEEEEPLIINIRPIEFIDVEEVVLWAAHVLAREIPRIVSRWNREGLPPHKIEPYLAAE